MPYLQRPFFTLLPLLGCVPGEQKPGPDTEDAPSDTQVVDTAPELDPAPTLVVNELMADNESAWPGEGGTYPDWIELYNPSDADIDLAGWSMTDDLTVPGTHTFTESLVVPAGGFVVLEADGLPDAGVTHLAFQLGADGDDIAVYDTARRRVDWIEFGEMLPDIAGARVVDGSEDDGWTYVLGGTPGASNETGE